jgi:hypothetical protein
VTQVVERLFARGERPRDGGDCAARGPCRRRCGRGRGRCRSPPAPARRASGRRSAAAGRRRAGRRRGRPRRARRPWRPRSRASGGPGWAGGTSRQSARSRYPTPRTVSMESRPKGRSIFSRR